MNFESKVKKEASKVLSKKDKILVAVSGGKDSTTVLYLLNKFGYNVEAIHVNLQMGEYSKNHEENIKKFCEEQRIILHNVNIQDELGQPMSELRERITKETGLNNCGVCGVIKRWALNKKAKELSATKVVTGHNKDDLIESIIMNISMGNPSLCADHEKNDSFTQRVKPLKNIAEREIKYYSKSMGFPVDYEICPYSVNAFRRHVRNSINEFNQEKFMTYYNKILPIINKKYSRKGTIKACIKCGEPSRGDKCRACELLNFNRIRD